MDYTLDRGARLVWDGVVQREGKFCGTERLLLVTAAEGKFAIAVYGRLRNPEPEGLVICLCYGSGKFPPPLRQDQFVGCGEPVTPDGGFFIPGTGDNVAQVHVDCQFERKAAGAQGLQFSAADEQEFVRGLIFDARR